MIIGYIVAIAAIIVIALFLAPIAIDTGKRLVNNFKRIWK